MVTVRYLFWFIEFLATATLVTYVRTFYTFFRIYYYEVCHLWSVHTFVESGELRLNWKSWNYSIFINLWTALIIQSSSIRYSFMGYFKFLFSFFESLILWQNFGRKLNLYWVFVKPCQKKNNSNRVKQVENELNGWQK